MDAAEVIALIEMIAGGVQSGVNLIARIAAAHAANDQATINVLRAEAIAFANKEAPAGSPPEV